MQIDNILTRIGSTPMFQIDLLENSGRQIFAKAEYLNPSGSIKDRIILFIINEAERKGKLKKGMSIIEASSGNTGISLAMIGSIKGYNIKIIMPDNMSNERKKLIKSLGAELILTPGEKNMSGAVKKLSDIQSTDKNIFVINQFRNNDNTKAHYYSTGPEIWKAMNGQIDMFVSGCGSGGTLMGVGKYLKEKNPDIRIVAVEPENVSVLLGQEPGLHKIEGIGDGFIPEIVDMNLIDDVIEVKDDHAIIMTKQLATKCGYLVGISSGANICGALELSKRYGRDKKIVTVFVDRAERYFSTSLFVN